jgi:pentose-5-phosphate-3-epimerase
MAEVKTKEGKKFTEEEMKKVQEIKNKYNDITINLGQLEMDGMLINEQKDKLKEEYVNTRKAEVAYAKVLSDKYGLGTLDIETGVFIPE